MSTGKSTSFKRVSTLRTSCMCLSYVSLNKSTSLNLRSIRSSNLVEEFAQRVVDKVLGIGRGVALSERHDEAF